MTDPKEALIERLRPKHLADEPIARAVVSNDQDERRRAVEAYLLANNALKSDAAAAIASLSASVGVTDGWKLVPIEPTAEMLNAWPWTNHGAGHERQIYASMLKAAPALSLPSTGSAFAGEVTRKEE